MSKRLARCSRRSRRRCPPIFLSALRPSPIGGLRPRPTKSRTTGGGAPTLILVENPDILARVAARETERPRWWWASRRNPRPVAPREGKTRAQGCDLVVANDVSTGVFGADENDVHIVSAKASKAGRARQGGGRRAADPTPGARAGERKREAVSMKIAISRLPMARVWNCLFTPAPAPPASICARRWRRV